MTKPAGQPAEIVYLVYRSETDVEGSRMVVVEQLTIPNLSSFFPLPIFDPGFLGVLEDGVDRGMSYLQVPRNLETNWRDGVQIGEGPRRTTSTRPGIGSLEDLLGLAPAPAPQPFTGLAVPGGTVMPGGVFVPSNCPLWVVDLNWVLISLWAVFPEPVRLPERPGRGSPSPRRVEPLPSIDHETLGLLLRQLYGLPVEIPSTLMSNGLELPVVSFEEAQRVISSGQIVNYHLDPFLQPWTGPPSGENRMVTLLNRDGSSSLVRARYDPTTRQIQPPV